MPDFLEPHHCRGTQAWRLRAQPYVGDGYYHDGDENKGAKSVRFTLGHVKPGRYEVRLAYLAHRNRATNTPVTVRSAEGTKTVQVNQRKKAPIDGLLLSLGTFTLDKDSALEVTNAGTDGFVVVDAVQLLPAK